MVDKNFYKNNGPMTLGQIADIIGAELKNPEMANENINDIASMDKAKDGEICFFYDRKSKEQASKIKAKACVTLEDLQNFVAEGVALLLCANPKEAYLKLNQVLYEEYKPKAEISDSASIHQTAKIGANCFIGANVVVEENVEIGENCRLEANSVISRGCKIGNNCRIGAGAYVSYCIMGNDCYIYSGARIGCDGFGFAFNQGRHVRIPQVGRIIIGNDVEIGANACIDRGALDDTVIGDGCRIDNLVQVAHNDVLGRGCILVSQTGIAGSCTLGDYVVCGGQVGLADHLKIGSGAQIAAQSGVMRDVEAGAVVMGSPTVPIKDFMRQVSFLQKNSKK